MNLEGNINGGLRTRVQRVLWAIFITFHLSSVNFSHLDRLQNHLANWNQTWLVCSVHSSLLSFFIRIPQKEQEAQRCFSMWSILTTHLDESWTHHFQLRLTKVFKFYNLTLSSWLIKLTCYKYPCNAPLYQIVFMKYVTEYLLLLPFSWYKTFTMGPTPKFLFYVQTW